MRRWVAILAALLAALSPGLALAQGPAPLTVAAGEVVHGDLASVDRPIVVEGTVEGDVTSLSGTITVSGAVYGDVVSYAGSIDIAPQAEVGGSVLSLGGGVVRDGGARVAGEVLGEEPFAGLAVAASLAPFLSLRGGAAADLPFPLPLLSAALALMALLVALVCASVWPRRTLGVSLALRRAPGRAVAVGLLTTALVGLLLLPIGGLLAMSLVGLPLLLPLTLALQIPYLFGLACVGRALAVGVGPAGAPEPAAAAGVALLLLPLGVVGAFAPLWGAAIFYLVASAGLGAAILSRGGAYAVRAGV